MNRHLTHHAHHGNRTTFLPTRHGTVAQRGRTLSLRHISAALAHTPAATTRPRLHT